MLLVCELCIRMSRNSTAASHRRALLPSSFLMKATSVHIATTAADALDEALRGAMDGLVQMRREVVERFLHTDLESNEEA